MMLKNPWFWLMVTLATLALCTWLPIKIKDDGLRRLAYWIILIPVSLIIIFYVYPQGIELFRKLAVGEV